MLPIPQPDPASGEAGLETLARTLDDGGVLALPTDTVYGLAARLDRPKAIDLIRELKGRPDAVPIAVLVADTEQAWSVAEAGTLAVDLATRHWPGALTLVLASRNRLGDRIGSVDGSIGVRCPDNDLLRGLARRCGPLATTSANPHGEPTPQDAAGVAALFPSLAVIDGGVLRGIPSTVVDARSDELVILRAGGVDVG